MFWHRKQDPDQADTWANALVRAAEASMAVIRFHPDGTIIDANQNFLAVMGYALHDVQAKHHRMFVDPAEVSLPAYGQFWPALAAGKVDAGEFRRITQQGKAVWLSASYTPIIGAHGKVVQVVKFAQDITASKTATLGLIDAFERLSNGDFAVRLQDSEASGAGKLRHSFNTTAAKLDHMVKGIDAGTGLLDDVTTDVETVSRRLSSDTAQQEQELAEIKAAVAQISALVGATIKSVAQLDQEAAASAQKAKTGAEIVAKAVAAIRSIDSLAREVSQNTQVIESFAFQTNLLSLNAAVEAARAGDAGLGFAVVAAEVRALANKSREASQLIASLTRRCEEEVSQGTKLIESAGFALADIEDSATNVAQATARISDGSRDQSRGIKMVEQSLSQIDASVQGVIGLARDGDEQAARLKTETTKLRHLVQSFTHDRGAGPGAPVTARPTDARQDHRTTGHRRAG